MNSRSFLPLLFAALAQPVMADVDPGAFCESLPINFVEGLEGALLTQAEMQDDNAFSQDAVPVVQHLLELDIAIAAYSIYFRKTF